MLSVTFSAAWVVEWIVLAGIAAGWALGVGYWGTRRGWSAGRSALWCGVGCAVFAAGSRWGWLSPEMRVLASPERVWGWWGGESVLAMGLRCGVAAAAATVVTGGGRRRTAAHAVLAVLLGAAAGGLLPGCVTFVLDVVAGPGSAGSAIEGIAYPAYCAGRLVAATAEAAVLSGTVTLATCWAADVQARGP
jgi:hypothetical protein